MRLNVINDVEHWRKCAQEARAQAARMESEERRRLMLRIASDYDGLVERALKGQNDTAPGQRL